MYAQQETDILSHWNGALDPWQKQPNYITWTPSSVPGNIADGTRSREITCSPCYQTPPPQPPGGYYGGGGGDSIGGGGGGTPVSYPGHAAQYGDQCSSGSLSIGQEVPGYGDPAHLANGTWTINLTANNGIRNVIGYVYPTLGGNAYFVPISSSINVFVFGMTINSSQLIGNDSQAGNVTDIWNNIQKFIRNGNVSSSVNCYPGGNWNGTYPA